MGEIFHVVEHRRCVVLDSAPWTFGLAEHVMGIGGRELHTDTHASAHLTSSSNLKDIVRVKIKDRGEGA
jgi:hypothetical protein